MPKYKVTGDDGKPVVVDAANADEAVTKVHTQGATAAVTDPTEQYQLTGGGVGGSIGRFIAGAAQGELSPWEGLAQFGDLEKKLPAAAEAPLSRLREISETPAGRAGSLVGTVVNPAWALVPELKFAESYGWPVVRGIGHLARQALRAGTAAATQPVDETKGDFWRQKQTQVEEGGGIGAILGGPGGLARLLGFEDFPTAVRSVESHIPVVKSLLDAGRSLSMPDFNRAWYRYVVQPIKGLVPAVAGHKGMEDLETQIGLKLDQATAGASFDINAAGGMRAWNLATQIAQRNLSGDAFKKFNAIIQSDVGVPLANGGAKLDSKMLQKVTSDLQSQIRAIKQNSEDNRALRGELGEFRMWILDNATYGSPQQKADYGLAREAWKRLATGRDSVPLGSGTGLFTPDDLAKELDRRYPGKFTSRQAPGQEMVSSAQRAPFLPGRAATNVVKGRRSLMPTLEDLGGVPAAGAVTGKETGGSP